MALLLRFSAVKIGEGLEGGRKSDLSLDVSMVEIDSTEHSLPQAPLAEEKDILSGSKLHSLAI